MRWCRHLVLTLALAVTGVAAEATAPGTADPAAPAAPEAIIFRWDHYRSIAVIGEGVGLRRPAWIGTWDVAGVPSIPVPVAVVIGLFGYAASLREVPLAVAYRALAWRDAQGRLHLVARGAALAGPQADAWSPDSFLIDGRRVASEDDQQSTQEGLVSEIIPADDPRYQQHLLMLQALCGDGI